MNAAPSTLRWEGGPDGTLWLLDQTQLPGEVREIACRSLEAVERAIKTLQVRGAPAIGIAAAYGVCVGVQNAVNAGEATFFETLERTIGVLAASRPTAVNLFMALERLEAVARRLRGRATGPQILNALWEEACALHDEDRAMCHAIGRHGAALMPTEGGVLTHCNAGGLATAEYGTALAVIFSAHAAGKRIQVYVDETRPLLQGARLTAWELVARRIPATLICDNMAAQVMAEGRVQAVVVGADRIAANGDAANKIGTYGVAVLAQAHGIPFYIAAPATTFDLKLADGSGIPIEQRAADEVTHHGGKRLAPEGVQVYNPAFDVTPARLIAALITDRGVIQPVTRESIARVIPA
ncbi:MAG: S-methyl-5-thioribose-1-phosphate isomerase [Pirellulales bacterium]